MVWFLKTESEPNFGFTHIPNDKAVPHSLVKMTLYPRKCYLLI